MKKKLWIFIDWYLPAFKAGGPIQSISNLVDRLKGEYDISVITSNSDLTETLEIEDTLLNVWVTRNNYRVMYLDANHQNKSFFLKLFKENILDIVYFNSMFSLKFTLLPLWICRHSTSRKVLATRGMLGEGALRIKPFKKKVFLNLFKGFKFHKKVIWHATAESEVKEISKVFGENVEILLAPNLSAKLKDRVLAKTKIKNNLNLFFLSRISIKKNLLGALEILLNIPENHHIRFNIIGPIEDKLYWQKCMTKIDALPKNIKVNYLGAIPNNELAEFLKDEHVMLLPTFHENFGHVIMESWQNSCPVIISNQTPWLNLKAQKLGHDIPLKDILTFANAITAFSEMDQIELEEWSMASYSYAKSFIENPKVLEQNKALFLKATKQ